MLDYYANPEALYWHVTKDTSNQLSNLLCLMLLHARVVDLNMISELNKNNDSLNYPVYHHDI